MADVLPLKVNTSTGAVEQLGATDTVPPANLGSGTRDGTRFLRDDGTWQTAGGGGASGPDIFAFAAANG